MMLVWIIFFTMIHEEEEIAFNALIQTVVKTVVNEAGGEGSEGDDAAAAETFQPVEDSEF